MSTPFPPNKKLKGFSEYAPPRVRDRAFSQNPAEVAETPAQAEVTQSEAQHTGLGGAPATEDARPANETGAATDPLDWIDDAIREVVALNGASENSAERAATAPYSPSITPMHDESDERPSSEERRQDRAVSRTARPRAPRLETQVVPPPPPLPPENGRLGQILRASLMIVLAAIVAYGVTLFYPSRPDTPPRKDASERIAEAPSQQKETRAAPPLSSRLVIEDKQAFANEPVSLAVDVEHATANESLLLDGLAQGTALSAGTSIGPASWQVPPDKLKGLYLYAPKGFVGIMNATVKLLGPDRQLLDSRAMQLTWVSKPPPQALQPAVASAGLETPAGVRINPAAPVAPAAPAVKAIDPGEAAMLMQRARDSLTTGDISAARVALRRLADAGKPDAALALANTYDPLYLAAHNVVGVLGDRTMARTLYQRAKDLGSAEAARMLGHMGAN